MVFTEVAEKRGDERGDEIQGNCVKDLTVQRLKSMMRG
jgi:hypothetical protein